MNETSFYCKPAHAERIETKLHIAPDTTAAIHGTVFHTDGTPVSSALALLFRVDEDTKAHTPLAQTTTDADGQFAFGMLTGDVLYRVKIFRQGTRVRVLEIRGDE